MSNKLKCPCPMCTRIAAFCTQLATSRPTGTGVYRWVLVSEEFGYHRVKVWSNLTDAELLAFARDYTSGLDYFEDCERLAVHLAPEDCIKSNWLGSIPDQKFEVTIHVHDKDDSYVAYADETRPVDYLFSYEEIAEYESQFGMYDDADGGSDE